MYRPTAEGVGLTGSRPYDLRHSFASLLINEGVSVLEVARQLGNSPDVTLTTYAHVFEEFEPAARISAGEAIEAARAGFDVREEYAEAGEDGDAEGGDPASMLEADARTRTGDPFITSEVLYQLSYVGGPRILAARRVGHGHGGVAPAGTIAGATSPSEGPTAEVPAVSAATRGRAARDGRASPSVLGAARRDRIPRNGEA